MVRPSTQPHANQHSPLHGPHLLEAAAARILQVAEVEVAHLLLELAELDARLLNKGFVDLLDLLCNGKGAEEGKRQSHYFLIPYSLRSTSCNP